MGLGRARSVALVGLDGYVVDVESSINNGLPTTTIVGLPDTAVGEARERVRAAVASSGVPWPQQRVTVNLSPASLPKTGSALDLAVAAAVCAADGLPGRAALDDAVLLGELALDGGVRRVRGILPAVLAARTAGVARAVVPAANADEARLIPGIDVMPVEHLADVVTWLGGEAGRPRDWRPSRAEDSDRPRAADALDVPDMADVVGQDQARHALEVAAAGAHHLAMTGAPGSGKTMLAARLPTLLPDLDDEAALEVTSVASLNGRPGLGEGLIRRPPYEAPHHSASAAAIVGGGTGIARPGAISRAHRGVLFLDEAPEFPRRVLDTLRQPIETGEVVLHRAKGATRYPARFQLVLASNPCPCGMALTRVDACTCTSFARRTYAARLSGPLLDRIDVHTIVQPVTRAALAIAQPAESSAAIRERVARARARQRERWAGTPWRTNAEVAGAHLRGPDGGFDPALRRGLLDAVERGTLTMRGVDRCLRLAWTLADLAEHDRPATEDVAGALVLRGTQ